jgi:hypothetical protein
MKLMRLLPFVALALVSCNQKPAATVAEVPASPW